MIDQNIIEVNLPGIVCEQGKFGFNSNIIAETFLKNDGFVIQKGIELDIVQNTVQYIIDSSISYDDGDLIKTPHKRFQIIINSEILEMQLASIKGLIRNSNSEWLLNGKYEVGTDFNTIDEHSIEAKVYYSLENMWDKMVEANKGNRYVFHLGEFVCCYIINNSNHWQWLKKVDGKYQECYDAELIAWTKANLPKELTLCRCIIEESTGNWILRPFYN